MARTSRAGDTPFRGTTSIVSSPAMVPSTSRMRRLSRAEATLLACPGSVRMRPEVPGELQGQEPPHEVLDERRIRPGTASSPASTYVYPPSGAGALPMPSRFRSRDRVACVTVEALLPQEGR